MISAFDLRGNKKRSKPEKNKDRKISFPDLMSDLMIFTFATFLPFVVTYGECPSAPGSLRICIFKTKKPSYR